MHYNRWVLTAAHCVFGKDWKKLKVVLGDYDVTKKERQEEHVNICGINVHPLYEFGGPTLYDIALLELCRNVRFTEYIQPIQLARENWKIPDSSPVTVAGWGVVEYGGRVATVLRKVTLNIIRTPTCRKIYAWISDGELCAGNITFGGKDSCQGDSGGALWFEENGKTYQVGIVSHGIGCARRDAPGVYTRITHYKNWIEKHMTRKLDSDFLPQVPTGLVNEFGAFMFPSTKSNFSKSAAVSTN